MVGSTFKPVETSGKALPRVPGTQDVRPTAVDTKRKGAQLVSSLSVDQEPPFGKVLNDLFITTH